MAKQDLHFSITATNDDLKRKLAESRQAILDSGKTAEATASRIDGSFKRMAASAAVGFSAISLGKSIIRVRGEMQMMEQSFEVLLQSKSKAAKMISDIKQLAIDSPLEMPQVSSAAQTLLGFGVDAQKVMGIVSQLSDVSMGNADRFQSLALVYAQCQSAGKLMGQDLLQMINAGFNPLQIISEQTGKSIAQLKDEMSKGAISADMVAAAFEKVTSEGGKFYNMTKKQADGIVGLQATFEDAITNQLNRYGEKNEELIESGYKFATSVVENSDKIISALIPIVAAYGVYKASIIAVNAIQRVNASVQYAAEIAELQKLLPTKQASANADIEQAVAKGRLSQATAERLIAIRAEVQAELEGLRVKAQALAQEVVAATQADGLALKQALNAERKERAAREELSQAMLSGNAQKIRRAEIKLTLAEEELSIALKNKETTANTLVSTSAKAKSAATAVDTMQNNINTASTNAGITAKNLFTAATGRLTKAFRSLKVAFATNPIGMILTGVTMAISLFSMFGNSVKNTTEQSKALASTISGEVNKALLDETTKLQSLRRQLAEAEPLSKKRIDLIKELKREYPDVIGNIDAEKSSLDKVVGSIDAYIVKLSDKMRLQILEQKYIQNTKNIEEAKIALESGGYSNKHAQEAKRLRAENALILEQIEYQQNLVRYSKEYADLVKARKEIKGGVETASLFPRTPDSREEYDKRAKELAKSNENDGLPILKLEPYEKYLKRFEESLTEADKKANRLKEINAKITEAEQQETSSGGGVGGNNSKSAAKDYSSEVVGVMLKSEQLKLDVMRDGRAKELAQIEQTKKEKLAAIDKEQKEIAAKLGAQGKKLTKDDLSAFDQQRTNIGLIATNDTTAVNKKYDDEIADHWKALTTVFLSEEQKRTGAIEDRYNKERKWVDEVFDKNMPGMMPLNMMFKMKIDATEAHEQLKPLLEQYQTDADKRKEIEAKFNTDIADLQAKNKDGKLDGNIAEAEKQKKAALSKVNMDELSSGVDFTKLFGNLDNMNLPSMNALKDKIKAWIDGAGNSLSPEDLKAVSDAFLKLEIKIADKDPFAVLKSSIADHKTAVENVDKAQKAYNITLEKHGKNSIEAKEAAEALTAANEKKAAAVAKANESIGSVADKGKQIVGAAQDVLGIMSDLGVKVPEEIGNALGGIGQVMDGLGSIDLSSPLSVITGAVKMIGGLVKTVTSLFNGDNKKEAEIQRLQGKIDATTKSYEKLGEAIDEAYSSNAADLIKQSNTLLDQQNEQIKKQKELEQSKKDPDTGAIEAYDKAIEDNLKKIEDNKVASVDAIFGSDLQSAIDDFASAYMDAWASGEDRAAAQKDVVKKMIRGIIQEMLKSDIKGSVEKMRKQIEGFMADDVLSDWELGEIDKMGDQVGQIMEQRGKIYDKILKDDKPEEKDEGSLAGQIRGTVATEQSVAELGGIFRGQHERLSSIDRKMDLGITQLFDIARTNLLIEVNTRRTADNTGGLRETVGEVGRAIHATNERLEQVIRNTKLENGTT